MVLGAGGALDPGYRATGGQGQWDPPPSRYWGDPMGQNDFLPPYGQPSTFTMPFSQPWEGRDSWSMDQWDDYYERYPSARGMHTQIGGWYDPWADGGQSLNYWGTELPTHPGHYPSYENPLGPYTGGY